MATRTFLFLDANPHLFNDNLPGGNAFNTPPPAFVRYPTALGQWVINDLDSSRQLWKIVVFHQPAFSSGDATIVNSQMRAVAKLLEDHGVNMVFNGHEHNYQRSLPIRATDRTAAPPALRPDRLLSTSISNSTALTTLFPMAFSTWSKVRAATATSTATRSSARQRRGPGPGRFRDRNVRRCARPHRSRRDPHRGSIPT